VVDSLTPTAVVGLLHGCTAATATVGTAIVGTMGDCCNIAVEDDTAL
jgi:hypothetical protein